MLSHGGGAIEVDVALEVGVVFVYHGSINDAASIRANGFDPDRGAPYVSTDINAARDAIGAGRYDLFNRHITR